MKALPLMAVAGLAQAGPCRGYEVLTRGRARVKGAVVRIERGAQGAPPPYHRRSPTHGEADDHQDPPELDLAGTGHFYVTKKNARTMTDKMDRTKVRSRRAQACRIQGKQDQVIAFPYPT